MRLVFVAQLRKEASKRASEQQQQQKRRSRQEWWRKERGGRRRYFAARWQVCSWNLPYVLKIFPRYGFNKVRRTTDLYYRAKLLFISLHFASLIGENQIDCRRNGIGRFSDISRRNLRILWKIEFPDFRKDSKLEGSRWFGIVFFFFQLSSWISWNLILKRIKWKIFDFSASETRSMY